ncbi:MAG: tetratricopeptide repeat protein [Lachnospiraceae bacterium]|nr:tetratricopeptide repeat protein [Lachnospiraceae bacterium]
MNCPRCKMPMEGIYICRHCGYEDKVAKKIIFASNRHYNEGLSRAKVRDLSGASDSLQTALRYNKRNTQARNLLGLIYYQMGEIVPALAEWVISLHFQEHANPAKEYIQTIQDNPQELAEADRIIQQYNQALESLKEGNDDMAIMNLKKAVNLNPNYVKAYQLLGLLYMRRHQYTAARKAIMHAVRVDRNNITTLKYLKELNVLTGNESASKVSVGDRVIDDPVAVVVEENSGGSFREYNTGFISFINVLIGIVIGIAVVWLLVVPSVTAQKTAEYNDAVVVYSAQISDRNKEIDDLNNKVEELNAKIEELKTDAANISAEITRNDNYLYTSIQHYLAGETYAAGMSMAEVDPELLTDDIQKELYNTIYRNTVGYVLDDLFDKGVTAYENYEYIDAITQFKKVLRLDDSQGSAVYYIGRSYQLLGDKVNAQYYYEMVINEYPNNDYVGAAQQFLKEMLGN